MEDDGIGVGRRRDGHREERAIEHGSCGQEESAKPEPAAR